MKRWKKFTDGEIQCLLDGLRCANHSKLGDDLVAELVDEAFRRAREGS